MKKIKLYLDTSVIGGCFDKEFEQYSNRLFDNIRKGGLIAVVSDITAYEISKAPSFVKEVILSIPPEYIETVETTDEMRKLAERYMESKIVSEKYELDALHIAIATVIKIDVLVSWNFRHIVNFQKIHQFNAVNLKEGYPVLDIRTPMEVIGDEE
ncbi:MAG: PIN domain protein [Spirochaetes bacterium GWF1_49_6]|nr:MAG: PIN domain protein [Spirochaetes bacterium GWF1_49_6]